MNRRPLGYEGKFSQHNNQDEPTQTNDDEALLSGIVGAFWLISAAVLHSRFIGCDRRPMLHVANAVATRGGEASAVLLNDLIRPLQQRRRDRQPEGLGRLAIDNQLEGVRLLNG